MIPAALGEDVNKPVSEFWKQRWANFPVLPEMAKFYRVIIPGSLPVESMFSTAAIMFNSRRSSVAPYKSDMAFLLMTITMWCVLSLAETKTQTLLLRPRARLRSIVMTMSVRVSVCLTVCPRGYLRNQTRDLY